MPIVWDETLVQKQSFVKVEQIQELRGYVSSNYDHTQEAKGHPGYMEDITVAANPWIIEHNLNSYPSISTYDELGEEIKGDNHYDSLNQITITFDVAITGRVILN